MPGIQVVAGPEYSVVVQRTPPVVVPPPANGTNVALASAGGVASALSVYDAAHPIAAMNDGDRMGVRTSGAGMWQGQGGVPQWGQITFNSQKTIDRVTVYTCQDDYLHPVEPTDAMTFSQYGIQDFTIEGWNGAAWVVLATVTGNNKVKRNIPITPPYTTNRILVRVSKGATDGQTRIAEIEAFGADATGTPPPPPPPPPPPSNADLSTLAPNTARDCGNWIITGNKERSDYSPIAYDGVKKRMLLWGGGHGAGQADDILSLTLSTMTWSSLYPSTSAADQADPANRDTVNGRYINTNHPMAVHGYRALVVGNDRKLWLTSVSGYEGLIGYDLAANDAGTDPTGHNWTYSRIHNLWDYQAGVVAAGNKLIIATAELGGSTLTQLWLFDPAADTAVQFLSTGIFGAANTPSDIIAHPPTGKYYIFAPLNGVVNTWVLDFNAANPNASVCTKVATTGSTPTGYVSMGWDPFNSVFCGCLAAGQFYQFDPVTKAWKASTVLVESGSTGVPDTAFFCGNMDPDSGCWIALKGDGRTWAYRPPPFSGAPTGPSDSGTLTATLDFGGGKVGNFTGGVDQGTFDGEFVHQRCFPATDPAFPDWRVYFRPDVDGKRDEVVVEYGRARGATPTNVGPYTATIKRGATVVYTATVPGHRWYARWRWQSAPRPIVRTPAVLKARGWIPNFGPKGLFGLAPFALVDPWTGPFCSPATMSTEWGATGDNLQIGYLTEAAADYVINGTQKSLDYVRTEGEWCGNFATHMRDADGGMLNVQGDKLRYKNEGTGAYPGDIMYEASDPCPTQHVKIESAHWYPCPNLGWLLTDDPYLLEELQFGANWRLLFNTYWRINLKLEGMMYIGQPRALAWGLRDLFLLACSTPVKTPKWLLPRGAWKACTDDNLVYAMQAVNNPARVASLFRVWTRTDAVASWMMAWLNAVVGMAIGQGFAEWKPVFAWGIGLHIAQSDGKSGWNKQIPYPYYFFVMKSPKNRAPTDDVVFTSWKEASDYYYSGGEGESFATPVDTSKWDGHTIMYTNWSYAAHLRSALALAVTNKIPGAQACYDWLQSEIKGEGQARVSIDP